MNAADFETFKTAIGHLALLVVIATLVERVLAYVFEHEWFVRLATKKTPDPVTGAITVEAKLKGFKATLALLLSYWICWNWSFDIMSALFGVGIERMGIVLTGFVVAGGSAGAIALFQGYLNISKESRDAIISAKKEQAQADLDRIQNAKAIAQAEADRIKIRLEAEKAEAESAKLAAETSRAIAEAEKARLAQPVGHA